jgi:hypothetical protein
MIVRKKIYKDLLYLESIDLVEKFLMSYIQMQSILIDDYTV